MPRRPPESRNSGLQRFLSDLRCSAERRTFGDRRCASRPVPLDRRGGGERRARVDRRQMLSFFSDEDAAEIKVMIVDPAIRVACPVCEGHLMLGPPVGRNDATFRHVHCTQCRRSVALRTPPR
ncbi:MAG: hypothetical protein AMS18_14035 [Gemmatimonas sp. SG8_17]|nr:MAG: hypothetical protein AMS18_14035 [Gemmatimonas sp. SG8_17]